MSHYFLDICIYLNTRTLSVCLFLSLRHTSHTLFLSPSPPALRDGGLMLSLDKWFKQISGFLISSPQTTTGARQTDRIHIRPKGI